MAGDEKYHATLRKRKKTQGQPNRQARAASKQDARNHAKNGQAELRGEQTQQRATGHQKPRAGAQQPNRAPEGTPTSRAPGGSPTTEPQQRWGTTPRTGAAQPRGAGPRGPAGRSVGIRQKSRDLTNSGILNILYGIGRNSEKKNHQNRCKIRKI